MSTKPVFHPVLLDACKLTRASWAVLISHQYGKWGLDETCHLAPPDRAVLKQALQNADFILWLDGIQADSRQNIVPAPLLKEMSCGGKFFFRISDHALVLLGAQEKFTPHEIGIWKLVAHIGHSSPTAPADEEVDLLQHTVLELQQTQQELQARISAQREAEARLIQAAKLVAVGEMAAGVAHELNNPLTSVVGFTELALDELPVDATVRGDLELVLKEAHRARSVVRRLLDFARQAETIRVKADINELVDDVLVLTKHLMQTNNVQPVVKLGNNLTWVSVDRNQIKQVIINLANNALYAMPEGGYLEVETAQETRFGQNWVTLSIRDTGIGIPPENMERIFEPFFTTRGDRGGTGLGLSVTYGIVTDHGGMIEVESQLQIGSKFIVWLPLE